MPGGVRIGGAVAELRFQYRRVAELRDFTMHAEAGVTHLLATVVSKDRLWESRRPLTLVIPGRSWTWPILDVSLFTDDALRATVGPCEG